MNREEQQNAPREKNNGYIDYIYTPVILTIRENNKRVYKYLLKYHELIEVLNDFTRGIKIVPIGTSKNKRKIKDKKGLKVLKISEYNNLIINVNTTKRGVKIHCKYKNIKNRALKVKYFKNFYTRENAQKIKGIIDGARQEMNAPRINRSIIYLE